MKYTFPLLLTAFVVLFRLAGIEYDILLNVTPLFALFLCFRKELTNYVHIPLIGYIISDCVINWHYNMPMVGWNMMFMMLFLYSIHCLGRLKQMNLILKTFVATTSYFLLTSTFAWSINPIYGNGIHEWFNAVVYGMPQYTPAWVFYIKSLFGNLGFVVLFELVRNIQFSEKQILNFKR